MKHTLASVSGVRDQEMALLDEMLAACVREASNKSLEMIFSSHLFYQNRQERFIRSLAGEGCGGYLQLSPQTRKHLYLCVFYSSRGNEHCCSKSQMKACSIKDKMSSIYQINVCRCLPQRSCLGRWTASPPTPWL